MPPRRNWFASLAVLAVAGTALAQAPPPPPANPLHRMWADQRIGKDAAVIQAEREYLATQNVLVLQLLDQAAEGLHGYRHKPADPSAIVVQGMPDSLRLLIGDKWPGRTYGQVQCIGAAGYFVEALRVLRDLPTDAVLVPRQRALLRAFPPEGGAVAIPGGADSAAMERALEPLTDHDRLRYAYLERRRLGLQPELVLDVLALTGWTFARLADTAVPPLRDAIQEGRGEGKGEGAEGRAYAVLAPMSDLAAEAYLLLHSLLQPDAFRPAGAGPEARWEKAADRVACGAPVPLEWGTAETDLLIGEREKVLQQARAEYRAIARPILRPLLESGLYRGRLSLGALPQMRGAAFFEEVVLPGLSKGEEAGEVGDWIDWMGFWKDRLGDAKRWTAANPAPRVRWWAAPESRPAPAPAPGPAPVTPGGLPRPGPRR